MSYHHGAHRKNRDLIAVLTVSVIGGSIVGLACAYALASAGHKVTIYEASDGKNIRCGSVKIFPNGTIFLNRCGLETVLGESGQQMMTAYYKHAENDRLVGTLHLRETFSGRDIAPCYFLEEYYLWDWLYSISVDSGVNFRPNHTVVDIDAPNSTIILQNGEKIVSDMIIGADGTNGLTRSVITGRGPDTRGRRFLTAACTISCDEFRKDEELATLLHETTWTVWDGDGVQVNGQTNKGAKTYTVTIIYEIPEDAILDPSIGLFQWTDRFTLADLKFLDYSKFSGRILKVLNLIKDAITLMHVYTEQKPLNDLVCHNVVLVGQAAHGMVPGLRHNATLGLEDAETLRQLFLDIQDCNLLSHFLAAFEEIRSPRIAYVTRAETSLRNLVMTPEKQELKKLEDFLKLVGENGSADHQSDDEVLSKLLDETLSIWLYDAREDAKGWLSKWRSWDLSKGEAAQTTIYISTNVSLQSE